MRCPDCGIQLAPSSKATAIQRCPECARLHTKERDKQNKSQGIKYRSRGCPTQHEEYWDDRVCSACGGKVPKENERLCWNCYLNPPDEIAMYHEFIEPIFTQEEHEMVTEMSRRIDTHRGHLKEWWDALPGNLCPVCGRR